MNAQTTSFTCTINLCNSIIGVSLLTMPYCFQQCGILLASLMLILSGFINQLACHLLLKAAILTKRRSFEFLAFHTLGPTGKLVVEFGVILFLLGSCVAFFVVIGDLAPSLVYRTIPFIAVEASSTGSVIIGEQYRMTVLVLMAMCVVLPLTLLRSLESLSGLSALSMLFYLLLVLDMFFECLPRLMDGGVWGSLMWWQPQNILQALPIFAMALAAQPQLFAIIPLHRIEALDSSIGALGSIDAIVTKAIRSCTLIYGAMGFFGAVAFSHHQIPGNVLTLLNPASALTSTFQWGFVMSILLSFPLVLYPCKMSLYSLLFRRVSGSGGRGSGGDSVTSAVDAYSIPSISWRLLSVLLVLFTVAAACVLPDIELVLGLNGASIGTAVCIILPGAVFANAVHKDSTERLAAQALSFFGIVMMCVCTFSSLAGTASHLAHDQHHLTPQLQLAVGQQAAAAKAIASVKPFISSSDIPVSRTPLVKLAEPAKDEKIRLEPPEPGAPVVVMIKATQVPPLANVSSDKAKSRNEVIKKTKTLPLDDAEQSRLLKKIAEEQRQQKQMLQELQKEIKRQLNPVVTQQNKNTGAAAVPQPDNPIQNGAQLGQERQNVMFPKVPLPALKQQRVQAVEQLTDRQNQQHDSLMSHQQQSIVKQQQENSAQLSPQQKQPQQQNQQQPIVQQQQQSVVQRQQSMVQQPVVQQRKQQQQPMVQQQQQPVVHEQQQPVIQQQQQPVVQQQQQPMVQQQQQQPVVHEQQQPVVQQQQQPVVQQQQQPVVQQQQQPVVQQQQQPVVQQHYEQPRAQQQPVVQQRQQQSVVQQQQQQPVVQQQQQQMFQRQQQEQPMFQQQQQPMFQQQQQPMVQRQQETVQQQQSVVHQQQEPMIQQQHAMVQQPLAQQQQQQPMNQQRQQDQIVFQKSPQQQEQQQMPVAPAAGDNYQNRLAPSQNVQDPIFEKISHDVNIPPKQLNADPGQTNLLDEHVKVHVVDQKQKQLPLQNDPSAQLVQDPVASRGAEVLSAHKKIPVRDSIQHAESLPFAQDERKSNFQMNADGVVQEEQAPLAKKKSGKSIVSPSEEKVIASETAIKLSNETVHKDEV